MLYSVLYLPSKFAYYMFEVPCIFFCTCNLKCHVIEKSVKNFIYKLTFIKQLLSISRIIINETITVVCCLMIYLFEIVMIHKLVWSINFESIFSMTHYFYRLFDSLKQEWNLLSLEIDYKNLPYWAFKEKLMEHTRKKIIDLE